MHGTEEGAAGRRSCRQVGNDRASFRRTVLPLLPRHMAVHSDINDRTIAAGSGSHCMFIEWATN